MKLPTRYAQAEYELTDLLGQPDLDGTLRDRPSLVFSIEKALSSAVGQAYGLGEGIGVDDARLFLQRVLFHCNRLGFFRFDDPARYLNENSEYVFRLRRRIEEAWQARELSRIDVPALKRLDTRRALVDRVAADSDLEPSPTSLFFRKDASPRGWHRAAGVTALRSFYTLGCAWKALGGPEHRVRASLARLLAETGEASSPQRKLSEGLLSTLQCAGLKPDPEAYVSFAPWESLSEINEAFHLSSLSRQFLKMAGALLFWEASGPAELADHDAAARRLGLGGRPQGNPFYEERRCRLLLNEIALPLVDAYPDESWQVLAGYDIARLMRRRSSEALARAAREADALSGDDRELPRMVPKASLSPRP